MEEEQPQPEPTWEEAQVKITEALNGIFPDSVIVHWFLSFEAVSSRGHYLRSCFSPEATAWNRTGMLMSALDDARAEMQAPQTQEEDDDE